MEETKSVLSSYSIRMPKEKFVLSVDDFVRFDVAFQDDEMFRLLFRVAFVGGLRISETIGLQVSSFYPDRNSLLINRLACDHLKTGKTEIIFPKTEKSIRWVYLPDFLVSEISYWIRMNNMDDDCFLFHGSSLRYPIGANTVRRRLRYGIQKSKLPYFSFHAFRRSEASLLNDAGLSGDVISGFLGHDSFKTAQRYYLGDSDQKKEAVRKALNEVLGPKFK